MTDNEFDREEPAAVDSIFRALSDRRRRRIVNCLSRRDDESMAVEALDDRLPASEANSDRADGVEPGLHHVHLPKLDDANIVEYDERGGTVRYRERPAVETLLDVVVRD